MGLQRDREHALVFSHRRRGLFRLPWAWLDSRTRQQPASARPVAKQAAPARPLAPRWAGDRQDQGLTTARSHVAGSVLPSAAHTIQSSLMSAFLMGGDDIDLLTSAHFALGGNRSPWKSFHDRQGLAANPTEGARLVRNLLLEANWDSLGALYEDRRDMWADAYEKLKKEPYRMILFLPAASTIAAVSECYVYQSCEHTGWAESIACQIIARIQKLLLHELPGYEDAPWGGWKRPETQAVSLTRRTR